MLRATLSVISMIPVLAISSSGWPPDANTAKDYCGQRSHQLQTIFEMMSEDDVGQLWLEGIHGESAVLRGSPKGEVMALDQHRNNTYVELFDSTDVGEGYIENGIDRFRIGYRSLDNVLIEVFCAVGDGPDFKYCDDQPVFSACGQCAVEGRDTHVHVLYYWGTDEFPGQTECTKDDI